MVLLMDLYDSVLQKCKLIERDYHSPALACLVWLLYESGSRVSAVLAVRSCDITARGGVIIHQGKGSSPLVCNVSQWREYLLQCRRAGVVGWEYVNYKYVYRLCEKYRIFEGFQFGRNRAVTAGGRKGVAREVYSASGDIEVAKVALGHKSSSSTEYYVQDKAVGGRALRGVLYDVSGGVGSLIFCKNGVIRKKNVRKKYVYRW